MDYLITFLEGVITFISPCLLPMLPVYIAYFAGTSNGIAAANVDEKTLTRRTLADAVGFVLGFTMVFVALGALAGTFGSLLSQHRTVLDIVCGLIVIVFGLDFMGVIRIGFLDRAFKPSAGVVPTGFAPAVLFGIVFSIGWTPCVGAFLGSALLLASTQGSVLHGILLLLAYSAGLGVPFLLSAVVIEKLAGAFEAIKRHYRAVNIACGALLVVVGVLMMSGLLNIWLSLLSV